MLADEKYIKMTTAPLAPLIIRLAIPTMIIMMVSAMYNMADTYFVSSLGTSATASVGVSFSLMAIIQAVGFFFGHGSGNFISRALGAKNTRDAETMAATGIFSAFFVGVILLVFGSIFLTPLCNLLGSTPTILPYARDYLRYILIGAPFMMSSLSLNNLLRYQGSAFFSMIGMVSGAVLNCALDPLFIFVFHMGVKGAAIATMLSQTVSFILLFIGCRKGGNIRVSLRNFSPSIWKYKEIIKGGSPSLLRQGMASLAAVLLNHAAGAYSDAVIAAMAIVNRVFLFGGSAVMGFGQGFQPVCGFNYGAKLYARVKKAFYFCLKVAFVMTLVLAIVGFVFAPYIVTWFRDDPDVISVGTFALRAQCVTFPLCAWIFMNNFLLQTMGKAVRANILAFSRQGLFLIPLLYTLVPALGITGIELCVPIADVCTFILAIPLGVRTLQVDLKTGGMTPPLQ
jgi:putative MATE family efflux protein